MRRHAPTGLLLTMLLAATGCGAEATPSSDEAPAAYPIDALLDADGATREELFEFWIERGRMMCRDADNGVRRTIDEAGCLAYVEEAKPVCRAEALARPGVVMDREGARAEGRLVLDCVLP